MIPKTPQSASETVSTAVAQGAVGQVEAVCVVAALHADDGMVGVTAIDKQPVSGPVPVGNYGLRGDVQADRIHHGGLDQAVYLLSRVEADHWQKVLGRTIPAGGFGENLRISGLEVDDLELGARLAIGSTELEVTAPRTPCATFQRWMGTDTFRSDYHRRGRTGAYTRVVSAGVIETGDDLRVLYTPGHQVTVSAVYARITPPMAERMLTWARSSGYIFHHEVAAKMGRVLKDVGEIPGSRA
ncbi:MOSC domain-containing protein [Devriesea agamarum]|uniref:MOSC domain-containing protein n=1 Tax=Devriesea agamarum TaxID=472569 RepID=UPI00071C7E46|nr:MOSC domain-containing protein [Devriesea agamarum]